jgi:Holliday junction resolvase
MRGGAAIGRPASDGLDHLIGQHGDEQAALGAIFAVVEHRSQAEVRLQAAEHDLQILVAFRSVSSGVTVIS